MNVVIKAGKVTYRLTKKNHGYDLYETVTKEVKIKDSEETEMKDVESWVGFLPNLQKVADRLFHCELGHSDASTLGEMLTVVNSTRQLIKTAGWTREDLK